MLRLHLGLIVPEPRERTAIRVGPEQRHWEEGRALIFDDAYEHEAWNETGGVRVVLWVDFAKPLRFPASVLNQLLLRPAVFTPFVREGGEPELRHLTMDADPNVARAARDALRMLTTAQR